MRRDFGIDVSGLEELPEDEHGVDVRKVLTLFRRAIMRQKRWDVAPNAYLGLFSFSKFVMWHDIKARSKDLKRSRIVSGLMDGQLRQDRKGELPSADLLDRDYHPRDVLCPISADSSQLSAICAAGAGRGFILHGPPGTGKSQTITNIIANALANKQTVLFVAEKMAALSVVQRRLEAIGLAPFCLEIHSNKARKKDVLDQMGEALRTVRTNAPQSWEAEANRLAKLRDELNVYVIAVHCQRAIGHSVFQGVARFEVVRDAPPVVEFTEDAVGALDPEMLRQWKDLVRQLRIAAEGSGHPHNHPWSS